MGYHLFDPLYEIWRPVVWFEDYYKVSTYGRIKTISRKVNNRWGGRVIRERLLAQATNKYGLRFVGLTVEGNRYTRYTHRLVAEAFLGPVDGYMVEFIDGDRNNCYLNNIRVRYDIDPTTYVHEIFIKKRKGHYDN